jgi:uncharacterized protein involved in outer membrane biogenesis
MRYLRKIIVGLIVFLALVGLAGFFIAPPIIKPVILKKISATLHREVLIEKLTINPYALSLTIRGFNLKEKESSSTFVSFEEFYVNIEGLASLFQRAVVLKEVRLTKPYVKISRNANGSYNFSDMIPKEDPVSEEEKKPLKFSVNNIQLVGGSVDFSDGPNKTTHTIRDMNLAIPFVSNLDHHLKNYIEPRFSAMINGHPFQLAGTSRVFDESRETAFDIAINDMDIPYYLNYIPLRRDFKLTSARLDSTINIAFVINQNAKPSIKFSGDITLKNLALDDRKNKKMVRLPALNITVKSAEPLVSAFHFAQIVLQGPELSLQRNQQGDINLTQIFAQKKQQGEKQTKKKDESSLKLRIDMFKIEAAKIIYTDYLPSEPAKITADKINLALENFSMEKGTLGNLSLSLILDKKGAISVKGPVGIVPLNSDLKIDFKNLGIRSFQPYFADKVRINVTRGTISAAGNLNLFPDGKGKTGIKYKGNLLFSDLATVDRAHLNHFVTWKSFFLDQLHAGYNPLFLHIKNVALTDFYTRIIINPDGTLNVQDAFGGDKKETGKEAVLKEPEAVKKAPPAKQEDLFGNVKIGKITLQGGTVDFSDRHIQPNYFAKMFNMTGNVTELSSEEISRATVELRGNLGRGSPVEIAGKINPLAKDRFADIKLHFKDIELSPVTPYSSKYVGHPIVKGKLNFDIRYLIEGRKLDAKHNIFIDQLTFGDKVDSPDAIKAPVTLAVSLLKDRNGHINLDIPVSGSLDDPKFSVWPIVWQIIGNLIMKALTAPFALLASLSGGEELSFVEFDYGNAAISEGNRKKIDTLAKALYEKPNVKMDIVGHVDPVKDAEGLKRFEFDRKLKAQKQKVMMKEGSPSIPLRQILIQPQDYGKYLAMAYESADFPKPRNAIGFPKKLPPQEMEKLLLAYIQVSDGDLRQLAYRRTTNVKDLILKTGLVTPDRIFILEPKSISPEKKEKMKDSRVDFILK